MTGWELTYSAALLAGMISFISPCVLPLVPGYLSFIAGGATAGDLDADDERARRWLTPLTFVAGFSLVFVMMGAGAGAIGQLLLTYRQEANLIGGALIVVLGLFMAGAIRPEWLLRDYRLVGRIQSGAGSPGMAGVLGVAFGVGWTPCIGPILGAILTVAATQGSELSGVGLLATYAAGLAVPFLLAAAFTDHFARSLAGLRRWGARLHRAAGVLLVVFGVAMMTGKLTAFAYWLLEIFPALGRIG
ncbi:MAG: cytochrome c biogenesis protein CcdA [Halofilum sp. (in: g-proteobacteria)]